MSIIQIIKEQMNMTERERDICRYILENPEKIEEMSSRELGHATFTSAASVTRFCQKIGVKGFPEFKMQFVRELRTGGMEDVSAVTMSGKMWLLWFGKRKRYKDRRWRRRIKNSLILS